MNRTDPLKLAVAGIGNNISALVQGVEYYRRLIRAGADAATLPGIRRPTIHGITAWDIEFVCAFDTDERKVGLPLFEAATTHPNNYPILVSECSSISPGVLQGLSQSSDGRLENGAHVTEALAASQAEVLLYSLPTGLQWAAEAYAECALQAGVGFVNCTPEAVGRNSDLLARFSRKGLPLVGDDLASHLGSSVLHREVLGLLDRRGLDLVSSYQVNLGGNEDFRNLLRNPASKKQSKANAIATTVPELAEKIEVVPSGGYIPHLNDNKVAYMNVEAVGWGGTAISVDLKLRVQDSSNAAGVIVDLVRFAGAAKRVNEGGFPVEAAELLKSPPGSVA